MCSKLEMLSAILVNVGGANNTEPLDRGRHRYWSGDLRAGTFRSLHNLSCRLVEDTVVERS